VASAPSGLRPISVAPSTRKSGVSRFMPALSCGAPVPVQGLASPISPDSSLVIPQKYFGQQLVLLTSGQGFRRVSSSAHAAANLHRASGGSFQIMPSGISAVLQGGIAECKLYLRRSFACQGISFTHWGGWTDLSPRWPLPARCFTAPRYIHRSASGADSRPLLFSRSVSLLIHSAQCVEEWGNAPLQQLPASHRAGRCRKEHLQSLSRRGFQRSSSTVPPSPRCDRRL